MPSGWAHTVCKTQEERGGKASHVARGIFGTSGKLVISLGLGGGRWVLTRFRAQSLCPILHSLRTCGSEHLLQCPADCVRFGCCPTVWFSFQLGKESNPGTGPRPTWGPRGPSLHLPQ